MNLVLGAGGSIHGWCASRSVSTNVRKLAIDIGNPARFSYYGYFVATRTALRIDFVLLKSSIVTLTVSTSSKIVQKCVTQCVN